MPTEEDVTVTASYWLRRARSSLALAQAKKPAATVWEDMCFNAQQAAEKAFKGVLVQYQIDFPKTHSIGKLIQLLEDAGHPVPKMLRKARDLTDFAVEDRYPFAERDEEVTKSDYVEAVEVAETVVHWAEMKILRSKP